MSSTAETTGRIATRSRSGPSKTWHWLAAAIVLLGVGCGVTWGVFSTIHTRDTAESLPRSNVPGKLDVPLAAGASRLIYFEGDGEPSPGALGLNVTAPGGAPVPVQRYRLLMRYELAGWVGTPIASFSAPVSGKYVVSAPKPYGQGRISVGDNFIRGQAISIIGALALVATSLAAGILIVVVVAAKRSRRDGTANRRRVTTEQYGQRA